MDKTEQKKCYFESSLIANNSSILLNSFKTQQTELFGVFQLSVFLNAGFDLFKALWLHKGDKNLRSTQCVILNSKLETS